MGSIPSILVLWRWQHGEQKQQSELLQAIFHACIGVEWGRNCRGVEGKRRHLKGLSFNLSLLCWQMYLGAGNRSGHQYWWFSGRILSCHAGGGGLIPANAADLWIMLTPETESWSTGGFPGRKEIPQNISMESPFWSGGGKAIMLSAVEKVKSQD